MKKILRGLASSSILAMVIFLLGGCANTAQQGGGYTDWKQSSVSNYNFESHRLRSVSQGNSGDGYPTCDVDRSPGHGPRGGEHIGNVNDTYIIHMPVASVHNTCKVSGDKVVFRNGVAVRHRLCGNKITNYFKVVSSPSSGDVSDREYEIAMSGGDYINPGLTPEGVANLRVAEALIAGGSRILSAGITAAGNIEAAGRIKPININVAATAAGGVANATGGSATSSSSSTSTSTSTTTTTISGGGSVTPTTTTPGWNDNHAGTPGSANNGYGDNHGGYPAQGVTPAVWPDNSGQTGG